MKQGPYKKIITALMIIAVLFMAESPVFFTPKKAEAASSILKGIGTGLVGCAASYGVGAVVGLVESLLGTEVDTKDKNQQQSTFKDTCLDPIAKGIAQQLLKDLTQETLNWINSGFKGSPLFVQNTGDFLLNVGKEQVGGYVAQIGFNGGKFPFGKDTARAIVHSWFQGGQNYLDNNAAYSLNKYIGDHQEHAFANNFNVGGWDAFIAQSFFPGNNPIGFQFEAAKVIQPISDSVSLANTKPGELLTELNQNKGFLNIKKCVAPTDYQDPADNTDTDWNLTTATEQSNNNPNDQDTQDAIEWLRWHTCQRWETQTPGNAIADKLTTALNIPENNLLNAKDLNDSLTAIFDALASQLFSEGVQSLADSTGENEFATTHNAQLGGYGSNAGFNFGTGNNSNGTSNWSQSQIDELDVTKDIDHCIPIDQGDIYPGTGPATIPYVGPSCMPDPNHPGSYVANTHNPNAIGGKTVGSDPNNPNEKRGLIEIQQAYKYNLKQLNYALNDATGVITVLDFCLPGPRPTWRDDVMSQMATYQQDWSDFSNDQDNDSGDKEQYFKDQARALFGFNIQIGTGALNDYKDMRLYANSMIQQYDNYYQTHYSATALENFGLAGIAGPAISEYKKLPGYRGVISQNSDSIIRAEGAVKRLYVMKADVASAVASNDQAKLSDIKQALVRLLPNISNEGQVSAAESDTVDATNNTKYIGEIDPLTGHYKSTSLIGQCEDATGVNGAANMTYSDQASDYFPFHYYALPGFPTYNMTTGPYPSTIGTTVYRRVYPGLSNYPTTPSPGNPYSSQDVNTFMPHQRVADGNDSNSSANDFTYFTSVNWVNAVSNLGLDFNNGGLSFRYFEDIFNIY